MPETSSICYAEDIQSDVSFFSDVRGAARGWGFYINRGLSGLRQQLSETLGMFASLESKHEVAIMYLGRTSEFLMMTSERMVIPQTPYTLEEMLSCLRLRGGRWEEELDGSHILCSVNGRPAALGDVIEAGVEIAIYSRKSLFEV